MSMIEKAARAIYEEDDPWSRAWPWPNLNLDCQGSPDAYRRLARAVIEALMEPTPGMVEKGAGFEPGEPTKDRQLFAEAASETVLIWQAMITAALNEGEGA